MTRFMARGFMVIAVLSIAAQTDVRAAEYGASNAVPTSSPTKPNTTPSKHHRHHRKATPTATPPAESKKGPSTEEIPVRKTVPATNTDAPGMSNSLGTNSPGSPNMGTSDHVPGTTGTSGQ